MACIILVGPLWSADSQGSDLVREAKLLGNEVILIIPASEYQPEKIHNLSDFIIRVEADTESQSAADEALAQITQMGLKPVGIFPANECGVVLAARIGTILKLPCNSINCALTLRDKFRQREALEAAKIGNPFFKCFTNKADLEIIADKLTYPIVMKPVDGLGKVGVVKAYNKDNLLKAFDSLAKEVNNKFSYCKMGEAWIIEEFIVGDKLTLEMLAVNEHDVIPMVLTETTVVGDNFIEMGHALPSSLPIDIRREIDAYGIGVLKAIGVSHGVVHLELIRRHLDGKIFVIELNGRIPGGRMAKLFEEASGNNYYQIVLDMLCNGRAPFIRPCFRYVAVHWFCHGTGCLEAINGFDSLNLHAGFVEKFVRIKVGDHTIANHDGFDRVGYSMNSSSNLLEAKKLARQAAESVELVYNE